MFRASILSIAVPVALVAAAAVPSFSATSNIVAKQGETQPVRVVQVDLDYIYDPDPAQQQRNLEKLISRLEDMQANTVFLQAFADPKGTGLASELYFPSEALPMRADLFGSVVTQLHEEAHVKVYGWLPVLSFDFGDKLPTVLAWNAADGKAERDPKSYRRLSPFDAEARNAILDIYADMAKAAPVDGVLFHDDALLSDYEDASPEALKAYEAVGLPTSVEKIRADTDDMKRWTKFKTSVLIEFTQELADKMRQYRQPIETVRNIYANAVLNPASENWYAQNYGRFLKAYDYTAIEAMPQMENVAEGEADAWMQKLTASVAKHDTNFQHTIFELQAVDWRKQALGQDRAIPTETLVSEIRLLTEQGAVNLGYYPDDFVTNTPDAEALRKDFSIQTNSYPL